MADQKGKEIILKELDRLDRLYDNVVKNYESVPSDEHKSMMIALYDATLYPNTSEPDEKYAAITKLSSAMGVKTLLNMVNDQMLKPLEEGKLEIESADKEALKVRMVESMERYRTFIRRLG